MSFFIPISMLKFKFYFLVPMEPSKCGYQNSVAVFSYNVISHPDESEYSSITFFFKITINMKFFKKVILRGWQVSSVA